MLDDRAAFEANAEELDILRGADADDRQILWDLGQLVGAPLLVDRYTCGTEDDQVLPRVKKLVPKVLARPSLRGPGDLVFLHRSLGGTYNMLRQLHHTYDYRGIFLRHTRHAVEVAEGRTEDRAPVGDAR